MKIIAFANQCWADGINVSACMVRYVRVMSVQFSHPPTSTKLDLHNETCDA
jgi:hypothetical protein